jgi:methylase of polypeptide subunit release factors
MTDVGRQLLLWRARRARIAWWRDGPLLVPRGVLDPVATKVGAWLAEVVAAEVRPGERWVDMGCGSGVVAIALARAGAEVTAIDVDPACVAATRANAALHGVTVEVVRSDLFGALPGRRFDVVAYNIPFWPGPGAGRPFPDALWAGEGFAHIRRFVREFPAHATSARVAVSRRGGDPTGAVAALRDGPRTATVRTSGWVRGERVDLYAL